MTWKEYSLSKLIIGIIVFIIGLILKLPGVLEIYPPKYRILGYNFTESEYAVINVISIIVLLTSVLYIVILLLDKYKK